MIEEGDYPYWPPITRVTPGQRVFVPRGKLWNGQPAITGTVNGFVVEGPLMGFVVIDTDRPIDCGPHGMKRRCTISPTILCAA